MISYKLVELAYQKTAISY